MKLIRSAAPHIHSGSSTQTVMRDVLIALMPAALAGIFIHGPRALMLMLTGVLSAMAGEYLFRRFTRRHATLHDLSAAVTGLLLAMSLPASAPYWLAAAGSLFAVVCVKGICGGLGQNCFNPALAARALLMLLWPAQLTRYPAAGTEQPLIGPVEMIASSTPLHEMQKPALPQVPAWKMLLGERGGCIGEVCMLALIAGGAYLIFRKVIRPNIPLACIGTVAVFSFIFNMGQNPLGWMFYSLFSGGLMLGAFFMATDYASGPVTPRGQLIYGAGCGALTLLFRYIGLFPEGFTYAVLLVNCIAWKLDEIAAPRRFGVQKGVLP